MLQIIDFMIKKQRYFCFFLTVILCLCGIASQAIAAESFGYQLALIDSQAKNPKKVLMNQQITPSNSDVREFEWILETLRNRCVNSKEYFVKGLIGAWRIVQRRGYDVSLLEFSRDISDFSNRAFMVMHNKKLNFDTITLKVIKDKYPQK